MREIVYLLCALTSAACTALLLRGYRRTRVPLLFWSSAGFLALAASNALLFVDLAIFPEYDLSMYRQITTLTGVVLLLYGQIRTHT